MEDVEPMPVGSWSGIIKLEGTDGTLHLPNVKAGAGYSEGAIFNLPFAHAKFFVDFNGGGGINLEWQLRDGSTVLAQIKFSHLVGGKAYHLAIDWDLEKGSIRSFVNGVEQGDALHGKAYDSMLPATWLTPSVSGGDLSYEDRVVARVGIDRPILSSARINPQVLLEKTDALQLEPIQGEFRRIYTNALDLDELHIRPVYETSFDTSLTVVRERELLDVSGKRVREPESNQWILEGDNILLDWKGTGLELQSKLPESKRDGAMVLWHNRELPENFLIEYAFTPERSDSGLNILFFNAAGTDGGSIFGLDQETRHGRFREYIVGSINNYHVSPWATDENRLRNSSNLRKNSGFRLLAIGNDRIGQHAAGKTHLVRVLKTGGVIKVEANGILVMEYEDPGTVHGPVLNGGIAGIRFMAHTGSVTMHNYRVYKVGK